MNDWKTIIQKTNRGFQILSDLSEMKAPPREVGKIHEDVQQLLVDNGLAKVAEVIEAAITEISVNNISKTSGMNEFKRVFNDHEEAEKWLNLKG